MNSMHMHFFSCFVEFFDSTLTWLNISTYVLFNFYNQGVLSVLKKKMKMKKKKWDIQKYVKILFSLSWEKERDGVLLKETFKKKHLRERERNKVNHKHLDSDVRPVLYESQWI